MSELADAVLTTDLKVGALIEESSLGTPGARELRRRVSPETANTVVAHAEAAPAPDDTPRRPAGLAGLDDVVPRAIDGDADYVAELLRMLRPIVVRYCNARLGHRPASTAISADDVSQEVLLAVIAALPRARHQDSRNFLAFVFSIAQNKVVDAVRADARDQSDPVDVLPDVAGEDNEPERTALTRELNRKLVQLLDALPPVQREILILRVVVGLSANETADAIGVSPGQVRVAQHRALTKLRSLYTDAEKRDPNRFWDDMSTAPAALVSNEHRPNAKGAIHAKTRTSLAAEVVKRYKAGASIRSLAESTGRSYGFVHRLLSDAGVPLRGRGGWARTKKSSPE